MSPVSELPVEAWITIVWRTIRHLGVAIMASVLISYFVLETYSGGLSLIGLGIAVGAPLLLGGPMILLTSLKHQQLLIAYRTLEATAARDSLTKCLNHGAFVEIVGATLDDPESRGGALLVVDADHFKSINDRFGHACGDTALKLIVSAIRANVSQQDTVGRLGGEEFGVFLPASNYARAKEVSEAIRSAVDSIVFEAAGQTCTLSVSIGGAISTQPVTFNEMFRHADRHLYKVKESGRNGVSLYALALRPVAGPITQTSETGLVYRGQRVRGTA